MGGNAHPVTRSTVNMQWLRHMEPVSPCSKTVSTTVCCMNAEGRSEGLAQRLAGLSQRLVGLVQRLVGLVQRLVGLAFHQSATQSSHHRTMIARFNRVMR